MLQHKFTSLQVSSSSNFMSQPNYAYDSFTTLLEDVLDHSLFLATHNTKIIISTNEETSRSFP